MTEDNTFNKLKQIPIIDMMELVRNLANDGFPSDGGALDQLLNSNGWSYDDFFDACNQYWAKKNAN